jgi:hypothetical protein
MTDVLGRLAGVTVMCLLLLVASSPSSADNDEPESDAWIPVGFLIIRSTSDYVEAQSIADQASKNLGLRLDLRGLVYDSQYGLTLPREDCEPEYSFPCYFARGRFDAGVYLSVERSDAYASFRPGLFIVIAASGEPASKEFTSSLTSVRGEYPDAYVKEVKVYHGCVH